ncbi:DUF2946 domain-containing protein [Yersinia alsatica]|uniref:DUF2946 domain-containing protein n=1 Tax=Yersinia alsatica TaxID=2890317 RepID=A0ABY5UPV0_9GAMM|nr:DUF2946 domain-containing protein [Yersinia alsatica]OWF69310.1 hypothetical protein B4901_07660 [Yersinia frederiksenii]UWM45487.1 DUF2946 domain-containing protein [Yersinia alsatica]
MSLSQTLYQRRHYSAWLGIAAILMLFIAPVVSVSLALSYDQNPPSVMLAEATMDDGFMGDGCMGDGAMEMTHHSDGETAHQGTQASHATQHGASHDGMMMDHAACGYCVLLTHLPLLNTAFKADIRSAQLLAELSPPLFISSPIIEDTYSESQPRAPPAFYS